MINIIAEINAYLVRTIDLYANIYHSTWQGKSSEQIMSRMEPSTVGERRYMDGSRIDEINVAYYAKSSNQKTASDQLDEIIAALDLNTNIEITEGVYILTLGRSLPFYVSQDESGNYIFTCSLTVQYHITH